MYLMQKLHYHLWNYFITPCHLQQEHVYKSLVEKENVSRVFRKIFRKIILAFKEWLGNHHFEIHLMHTLLLNRVSLSHTKLTMLPFLCCLNLKIDYVRLSVISNIFQFTMSNLSLCEHFFHLESIHNLLPLEVVHKCQHCYLCALQETLIGAQAFYVN